MHYFPYESEVMTAIYMRNPAHPADLIADRPFHVLPVHSICEGREEKPHASPHRIDVVVQGADLIGHDDRGLAVPHEVPQKDAAHIDKKE